MKQQGVKSKELYLKKMLSNNLLQQQNEWSHVKQS